MPSDYKNEIELRRILRDQRRELDSLRAENEQLRAQCKAWIVQVDDCRSTHKTWRTEVERLRAENEKHKLLWQEAEKRVFGADMWVRGTQAEMDRLRGVVLRALTASEAAALLGLRVAHLHGRPTYDAAFAKLEKQIAHPEPQEGSND